MDQSLLIWIQNITPQYWDWFFSWFSLLGRFEIISVFIIVFLWLNSKFPIYWYLGFFWYFIGLVLEFLAKNLIYRPAPPIDLNRTVNLLNLPRIHLESSFSFPSGHVYRMTFLTLLSAMYFKKTKNYPALMANLLLLLVMLYSRISLAEHWPTDVVGGIILALGIFKVFRLSFAKKCTDNNL
jgi:undecaprenyl-diphosphatase